MLKTFSTQDMVKEIAERGHVTKTQARRINYTATKGG
jgi:hypothetical protein